MRLVQFNIFEGCRSDAARLDRVGAWVRAQLPDVVTLNECNGWEADPGAAVLAGGWGLPHGHLLRTTYGYHIAVLSRTPITVVAEHRDHFWHGAVQVCTAGIEIIATHLAPTQVPAAVRLAEAAALASLVRPITAPLLVAGDLNCLSEADRQHYEGRVPDLRWALDYGQFRSLTVAGLADTWGGDGPGFTVPTAMSTDPLHHPKLRFDYVLANAAMLARQPRTRLPTDPELEHTSDHRPIICDWQ